MLEIFNIIVGFLGDLLLSIWGLVSLSGNLVWEVLYNFHVNAPRLEGLLLGILLAWLLARKEKHPLLKVVSAPLRLVIDILDLVWDQAAEFLCDIKEVSLGLLRRGLGIPKKWLLSAYSWINSRLLDIKNRVSKK